MQTWKQTIERWRSHVIVLMLVYGVTGGVTISRGEEKDAATAHTLRFFSNKNKPEDGWCMAFSPDSQEFLISTTRGTTSCIRVEDANPFAQFTFAARGIKYAEDGKSIVLMGTQNLVLFDRNTRQTRIPELPTKERGYIGLALQAQNGKLLVSSVLPGSPSMRDGRIQIGDELLAIDAQATGRIESVIGSSAESATERITGTAGSFLGLQILKPGASDPTMIKLQRSAVRDKNGTREFILAPDTESNDVPVAVVRQDHVELYSTKTAKGIGTIWPKDAHSGMYVATSPDGRLVAIAGSSREIGPLVEIHDTHTRTHVCTIPAYVSACHAVQFTPDGRSVLVLDKTRVVKIDVESQKAVLAMNHEGMIDLRSNPEIYFVDGNQIVREFTFATFGGGFRWRLLRPNPDSDVADPYAGIRELTSMAVNAEGIIAIATSRGEVHLLDLETCTHLAQLGQTGEHEVEMTDLSRDGKWAAFYCNGTLSLLNITDKVAAKQEFRDVIEEDTSNGSYLLTSTPGGFRAKFPSRPQFDAAQKRYHARTPSGAKFEVVWMEFRGDAAQQLSNPDKLQEAYDTLAGSMAKYLRGTLGKSEDRQTSNGTERRFTWDYEVDGTPWQGHGRVVHRHGRLFTAMVTFAQSAAMEESEIERLLESLELTEER